MVEVSLVTPIDFDRGLRSLQILDDKGIPIDAAFWNLGEDDEWEFFLHSPLLKTQSRKQVYEQVRKALGDDPEALKLREITLLPEPSGRLNLIRRMVSTGGRGIGNLRISSSTIDGVHIKDMLAYRL